MEQLLTVSGTVGVLLPLLVSIVNRSAWPAWAKGAVVIASSVVAGGVTAYLTGDLTGKTLAQSVLVIAGLAVGSYKTFWQPTGIGPAIERATEK